MFQNQALCAHGLFCVGTAGKFTGQRNVGLIARRASERLPFDGVYDGAAIDDYFSSRLGLVIGRLAQIAFFSVSAWRAWNAEKQTAAERGQKLRAKLAPLGPVFVKLAQTLATRPDVVAPDLA
eukprot:5174035-Amphidinium_carterae.1